jgi:hypothetical protein
MVEWTVIYLKYAIFIELLLQRPSKCMWCQIDDESSKSSSLSVLTKISSLSSDENDSYCYYVQ